MGTKKEKIIVFFISFHQWKFPEAFFVLKKELLTKDVSFAPSKKIKLRQWKSSVKKTVVSVTLYLSNILSKNTFYLLSS